MINFEILIYLTLSGLLLVFVPGSAPFVIGFWGMAFITFAVVTMVNEKVNVLHVEMLEGQLKSIKRDLETAEQIGAVVESAQEAFDNVHHDTGIHKARLDTLEGKGKKKATPKKRKAGRPKKKK